MEYICTTWRDLKGQYYQAKKARWIKVCMVLFEKGVAMGLQRLRACTPNFHYSLLWIYCLQFVYLLGFIAIPKSVLTALFTVMGGLQISMCRVAENLNYLIHTFPANVKQGDTVTSCFISHIVNKCPFHGLCHVFHICAFCW